MGWEYLASGRPNKAPAQRPPGDNSDEEPSISRLLSFPNAFIVVGGVRRVMPLGRKQPLHNSSVEAFEAGSLAPLCWGMAVADGRDCRGSSIVLPGFLGVPGASTKDSLAQKMLAALSVGGCVFRVVTFRSLFKNMRGLGTAQLLLPGDKTKMKQQNLRGRNTLWVEGPGLMCK